MHDLIKVNEFRLKLFPNDFYKMRKFYEEELGLTVTEDWDHEDRKGVMFKAGETTFELIWFRDSEKKKLQGTETGWEIPDVWSLYEIMKDKPYLKTELKDTSWGDTAFDIVDPEGFVITFFTVRDS